MGKPVRQIAKDNIYIALRSMMNSREFDYFLLFYRFVFRHGFRFIIERPEGMQGFAYRFSRYSMREGEEGMLAKMAKLKRGMDTESARTAERVYRKYLFIFQNNFLRIGEWFGSFGKEEERKIDKHLRSLPRALGLPRYINPCNSPDIFYFNSGLFFVPESVKERCIKGRDILDCGAYVGDTAIVFSRLYDAEKIYSFEPEDANHARLLSTIKHCGLKNVVPVKKGVGDEAAAAMITPLDCGSHIDGSKGGGQEIEVVDIDSFVKRSGARPGVIKMDIEGYELKAVRGALGTIERHRPILLIAVYHTPEDFFEIKPLLEERLEGYTFLVRQLISTNPVGETFLIGYPSS
jgi:FkbM family methyltransferase